MIYGDNLISYDPLDWTIVNGTITDTVITLDAHGSATQVINALILQTIPQTLKIELTASRYNRPYSYDEWNDMLVEVIVVDLAGAVYKYSQALLDSGNGSLTAEIPLQVVEHTSFTITIRGTKVRTSTISNIALYAPKSVDADFSNVVMLDENYYGVRVVRNAGIQVVREDGKSDMTLNSDIMRWRVKNALGAMVDKMYLDTSGPEAELIFDGKLSATLISALEAEFDVTISNTVIVNQLSAQKGNIAELTVDQLDTSDKVQKYLVSDTTDVDYIRVNNQVIEFVSAIKSTGTSQVTDRHGNLIYWLDATHEGTTLDVTAFPVMVYNYNEDVKMILDFKAVNSTTVPFITMGIGNGTGDQMKAKIYKDTEGLVLEYLTSTDKLCKLMVGNNGVTVANPMSSGLRNIAVGTTAPSNPQNNDLWIDTDA